MHTIEPFNFRFRLSPHHVCSLAFGVVGRRGSGSILGHSVGAGACPPLLGLCLPLVRGQPPTSKCWCRGDHTSIVLPLGPFVNGGADTDRSLALCPSTRVWVDGCPFTEATWLILPVVICLSQRLSHACVSISYLVL